MRVEFKPQDLMIVIPTLGRSLLRQTLRSFLDTAPTGVLAVVVFDGIPPLDLVELQALQVIFIENKKRLGYWGSLNAGLEALERPLVGFYADDVLFHPYWLESALNCYNGYFKDGKGLLAVHDGVWKNFHASHGFISRKWLWILYGEPKFPECYKHDFGDSELTQFSKDFQRFKYCNACEIEHLHYDNKRREWDEIDDVGASSKYEDGTLYPIRYDEWVRVGKREAEQRMIKDYREGLK